MGLRKAPTDIEQAYLLAKAHDDRIDWPYVEEEARKADITDYLAKLKTMLEKGTGRQR